MKKALCLLLSAGLLLCLSGCFGPFRDDGRSISFYYCRRDYLYQKGSGVLAPEKRELTPSNDSLTLLLTEYFSGPKDETLISPFPSGTRLENSTASENRLTLTLTDMDETLTDSQYSLGCACLVLTCLDYSQFETVTVVSGQRSVTLSADSLLLTDTPEPITEPSEETK